MSIRQVHWAYSQVLSLVEWENLNLGLSGRFKGLVESNDLEVGFPEIKGLIIEGNPRKRDQMLI